MAVALRMSTAKANDITGGLSDASKMPEKSFNLSARDCLTGAKLAQIPGSVCEECYALKNMYNFPVVINAQARRMARLSNPQWVQAMASLTSSTNHFRWFDAGDIQSLSMLIKIVAIAMLNPATLYWLPTKEYKIVTEYRKRGGYEPSNLIIRPSAPMIDQRLPAAWGRSSMVITEGYKVDSDVFVCDASHTMKNGQKVKAITKENKKFLGHCGDCRKCWDPSNTTTAYPIH